MSGAGNHDVDVAIVGYGPVGQALAALLGRAGHRVAAFERFPEIYRMPRAVHLDHEIMRLLQTLGLAEALGDELVPVTEYQWFGADGEPLLHFRLPSPAPSGWDPSYMFFQPELERAVDRNACAQPSVSVERGWVAEGLAETDDGVRLTVRRVAKEETGRLAQERRERPDISSPRRPEALHRSPTKSPTVSLIWNRETRTECRFGRIARSIRGRR